MCKATEHARVRRLISVAVVSCVLLAASAARAELPLARLSAIFPPGGQPGSQIEVTLTGQDLDGVDRLCFSHPGISAVAISQAPGTQPAGLKFRITVDPSVPPGLYDVRAVGLFGVSNPRTFEVCNGLSAAAKGGNAAPGAATDLPSGASMYAIAEPNVDHFYRVAARGRQRLCVEVATTSLDSKMEPVTVISDGAGHELAHARRAGEPIRIDPPADGICIIGIHDVLYRGGAEFFYRVRVRTEGSPADASVNALRWPLPPAAAFLDPLPSQRETCNGAIARASKPDATTRRLELPCEISGQFRDSRQRDYYSFDVLAGKVYWIEVVSQRLGQDTSPFLLVQRVERDEKGAEKFVDVQELYAPPTPAVVPEFPLGMRDPSYRLEVKQAGTYRLLVRDLFARDRGDQPAVYHLSILRESPDFSLVAVPASPLPEPADSKDVPVWSTLLRRGGAAPIKVITVRRHGFTGAISLHVGGLPGDVTAGPAIIPEGASTATIILQASDDARGWVGRISITGVGHTADGELSRVARAGVVGFSTYEADKKRLLLLRSRLSDQFVIATGDVETAPISITPTQSTFEAPAGGKVTLSFNVKSHADFTSPIVLNLAGHPLAAKQFPIDPKAEKASIELDLSQIKLPPGQYALHFLGQAKFKYSDSPELRAARIAQMNLQAHEDELGKTAGIDARALGQAIEVKDRALSSSRADAFIMSASNWIAGNASIAAAQAHASEVAAHAPAKELTTSIYSGAFALKVAPPPAAK
jgi:hypothetical protein